MKKSTERDDVIARQEGRGLVSGNGGGESQALSETGGIPDPKVEPRATRRHFSAAYKARIVEELQARMERPEDFPDQPHPVNQRYFDQQMWKLNGLAERLEGFERRPENHREMLENGRD